MMDGYCHLFSSPEEEWAYYARYIQFMDDSPVGIPYKDLYKLLKDKNYFILTTNVVILEQIEIIQNAEIISRDYDFEKNINYILVGIRRAGKSTLLYKIARELVEKGCDWSQIIYVNFEDDRLLGFTKDDFNDIVETAYELTDAISSMKFRS